MIVPAISWATTYHPLQQYGLKLRFLDVELDSVNMDVSQLEAALTPRTRAIMIVSILGNPAKLDVIRAFADRHGLYLIEDNCESLGARVPGGRLTGTFGELNTFSFFYSHHISTMEGGMVLTDDEELFHLVRSIARARLDARPAGGVADRGETDATISSRPTASSCPATTCGRSR